MGFLYPGKIYSVIYLSKIYLGKLNYEFYLGKKPMLGKALL